MTDHWPEPALDPPDSWWGPPELACAGCRADLTEENASPEALEYRAPRRCDCASEDGCECERPDPPLCRTCAGDERCLACGEWILAEDAEADPLGCVMCGARSRHGVQVPEAEEVAA